MTLGTTLLNIFYLYLLITALVFLYFVVLGLTQGLGLILSLFFGVTFAVMWPVGTWTYLSGK